MAAYTPRRYTARLMVGIAHRIADAGLAVYNADHSPYSDGERGIYFDHSPSSPGSQALLTCVITPYLPQPGMLNIEHTRIQIRARHPGMGVLEVRDWLDDMRALFPAETRLTIGGLDFDSVKQGGATSWGEPNTLEALETTQNFTFRGNRYPND